MFFYLFFLSKKKEIMFNYRIVIVNYVRDKGDDYEVYRKRV